MTLKINRCKCPDCLYDAACVICTIPGFACFPVPSYFFYERYGIERPRRDMEVQV